MIIKPYHARLAPDLRDKARAIFAFNEGQGSTIRDLLNPNRTVNLRDSSGASTYDTWSGGPIGAAFDYDGTVGHFAEYTNRDLLPTSITILLHLKVTASTSSLKICGIWTDGAPFARAYLLQISGPNNLLWVPDANGTQASARATLTNWRSDNQGEWVTIVVRAKNGERSKIWNNGVLGATSSANLASDIGNTITTNTEPFTLGSASSGSTDLASTEYDEPIALAAVFEALPESQCQYLSANPLSMFTPTRSRMLDVATWAAQAVTTTSNRRRRFFVGAAA